MQIKTKTNEKYNELIEHAFINQIEADLEDEDFTSLSLLLEELIKDPVNRQKIINYLSDASKENLNEGRTVKRY